jgi:HSP20 family molecular chaperone IbpA
MRLPQHVNQEGIVANQENGVLKITLPKVKPSAASSPKRITISSTKT